MKLLFRTGVLLLIILAFAAFLKPSHQRFKEFAGDIDANGYRIETRKVNDYLVSAIYEKTAFSKDRRGNYHKEYTERYTGYFLNFHLQESKSKQAAKPPFVDKIDSSFPSTTTVTDTIKL